ncbi:hypothetical protein RRG08_021804 [Elysia crispata]|uniref:G-protein coupled receptors family 1 profile domain-containing protein n=1 Tax=Elysia crispata TaxID=231223 RepID=A0AAE0ZY34_9GAST|nr:hypothetical protein RRG08_021804 [Elysia crispata]
MSLMEMNESDNKSLEELLALLDTYDGATYVNNVVLMIVYVPVFLVAVLGNILVLLVIFGDVKAAKSSANYFLVNLALADLLGFAAGDRSPWKRAKKKHGSKTAGDSTVRERRIFYSRRTRTLITGFVKSIPGSS